MAALIPFGRETPTIEVPLDSSVVELPAGNDAGVPNLVQQFAKEKVPHLGLDPASKGAALTQEQITEILGQLQGALETSAKDLVTKIQVTQNITINITVNAASLNLPTVMDLVCFVADKDACGNGTKTASGKVVVTFGCNRADACKFECRLDKESFAPCEPPVTLESPGDGIHTFAVRAIDSTGTVGAPFSLSLQFQTATVESGSGGADTSTPSGGSQGGGGTGGAGQPLPDLPTAAIATKPSSPSGPSVTLEFNCTTATTSCSYSCSVDGGYFSGCTSPKTLNGLLVGDHTFSVKAIDTVGQVSTVATHAWTVAAPETSITKNPGDLVASSQAVFEFSASGPGATGATFECRVDASPFAVCTSPHTASGLADGSHAFEAQAKDTAGNVDPTPASHPWTVDTAAPDTTLSGQPANPTNVNSANFTFTSPDTTATFECSTNGGSMYSACASPQGLTALADGSYTFHVRAKDPAGNVDPTPASHPWTVDTAAPTGGSVTIQGGAWVNNTSVVLSLAAVGAANMAFSNDGSGFSTFETYATSKPWTLSSGAGTKTVWARFRDLAGNTSDATDTIGYETTAPSTSITSPSNGAKLSALTSLSGTAADATSGVQTVYLFIKRVSDNYYWTGTMFSSGETAVTATGTTSWSYSTVPSWSSGSQYTIQSYARDNAGNTESPAAGNAFTFDNTAPSFGGLTSASVVSATQVDLGWSAATDTVSAQGTIIYRICRSTTNGSCQTSFTATYTTSAGATSYPVTGLTSGTTYYFVARAVDEAGNQDSNTVQLSATPATWLAQTSCVSDPLFDIYFLDTSTGYGVGGSGGVSSAICKTTDGGSAWTAQTSPTGSDTLEGVHCPVDASTCYAVGYSGRIIKTTNGSTWSTQTSGISTRINAVVCLNNNTCYAAGGSGAGGSPSLLKTTDGGATSWTSQTVCDASYGLWAIDCVDTNTCWAAGQNGTICKTINGGSTWTPQTSGVTNWLYGLDAVDASTAYVVGNSGTVLKTSNGGSSWSSQTSGTSNTLYGIHFPVDGTTGYAAGASGTVLKTTNGGAAWSSLSSGTTTQLNDVYFPSSITTGWVIGNSGVIRKTTTGGQ
ncbi:MAG: Ig-like domain repeat protein [Nitrospirae bacterium]|nr:Ig-like domain repeat protein [Nitrospirota bacterium]